MGDDRQHMQRALDLARNGEGVAAPNPMVGSVVVKDGAVVGEGWHKGPGTAHAEAMALAAAGDRARGATVYVTLEPCNHFGRTPPCVDAILASGAAEVVYALADPNPVAAGGAARLASAGVKVRSGVLEAEARALNRFWLHALTSDRPYVIAKLAMSLDGRTATAAGESKWITGPLARERGHAIRGAVDAIMVGAGTAVADDPALTARLPDLSVRHPLRVVVDSAGRTPPSAQLFDRAGRGGLIATTDRTPGDRLGAYRRLGASVDILPADDKGRVDLGEMLRLLRTRDVHSVLVEGGAALIGALLDLGLVDEAHAFIAPMLIGGDGKPAVGGAGAPSLASAFRLEGVTVETCGADIHVCGFIPKGVR